MNVLFGKTKQTNAHNGLRHTYTGETAVHTLNTDLYITIIVDFRTRRYGYGYLDVVAPLLVLLELRAGDDICPFVVEGVPGSWVGVNVIRTKKMYG